MIQLLHKLNQHFNPKISNFRNIYFVNTFGISLAFPVTLRGQVDCSVCLRFITFITSLVCLYSAGCIHTPANINCHDDFTSYAKNITFYDFLSNIVFLCFLFYSSFSSTAGCNALALVNYSPPLTGLEVLVPTV